MALFGIHTSSIDDIKIYHNTHKDFVPIYQVFVSPSTHYDTPEYKKKIKDLKSNNIKIVVHGSYSINLANRWSETSNDWWIQQLITEIQIANDIGAFCIVIHTGKKLSLSTNEALNNMYSALLHIHRQTSKYQNVKILIETPSGQGTETLTDINDFCYFFNKFVKHPSEEVNNRFGICVDTCHIFAAGYDISKIEQLKHFLDTINKKIGINYIKLFHINDSKGMLNSKLDRHDNLTTNTGKIGKNNILRIIKFANDLEIPMILETPGKYILQDYHWIKDNLDN